MSDSIVFSLAVYGMAIAISFLVAGLIKGIVLVLPRLGRRSTVEDREASLAPATAIPPEHVAVIAATVAAVMGPRHIIHIEDRGRATAWAAAGRMMHQTSHAVERLPKH